MKGCLSFIIKTAAVILIIFGLKYLGIIDFVKDKIQERSSAPQAEKIEKAKDIVDLSEIGDEYIVDKNFKILKTKVLLVQHSASGQKIAIFEPKEGKMFTKEDLKSPDVQQKIDEFLKKNKNKLLQAENVEVVKQGNFEGLNQTIPYVRIRAELSGLPLKDIEGIASAAELNNGKKLIIIAFAEKGKYSQIITEAFAEKIKQPSAEYTQQND